MSLILDRPLAELADDELVALFQGGDVDALNVLLDRYRRFARAKARSYFLVGADRDDIEQEGLIGLYKAARDFLPERQSSFRAFAELCVTRQVISAIKMATRQKHQPLNGYVSISPRPHDDEGFGLEEMLAAHHGGDPADTVVAGERMERLREALGELLSGLEVEVLRLYVNGKSYQEIGDRLGRHTKSIDNALQRIKRKLEMHLQAESAAAAA